MALVVPNEGEVEALEYWLEKTTLQRDQTLSVYSSNTTPAESDTVATYTKKITDGFAAKTLTRATWAAAAGGDPSSKSYAQQSWTSTADAVLLYGYLVESVTDAQLWWAEKLWPSGQTFDTNDVLNLTPSLEAA